MEGNLLRSYKNIISKNITFSEFDYDVCKSEFNNFFENPTQENSALLIKKIFENRQKETCLSSFADNTSVHKFYEKSTHSVSLYLLGLLLKSLIEKDFLNQINQINIWENQISTEKKSNSFTFDYAWFMTSLYHDISSEYEINCDIKNSLGLISDINKKLGLKITENIYEDSEICKKILQEKTFDDFTYTRQLIEAYYQYRLCNGNFDHGIIAGYIFYDSIIKNYEYYAENKEESFDVSKVFYVDKHFDNCVNSEVKFRFHPQQINIFKIVADAIISHNIWHDIECAKYKNIFEEISGEENKLSQVKYPLSFYLGLLDTIEPVKFFVRKENRWTEGSEITEKEILENINIDYKEGKLVITVSESIKNIISTEKKHEDKSVFEEWYNKISGLEGWLSVQVEKKRDNTIVVRMNNYSDSIITVTKPAFLVGNGINYIKGVNLSWTELLIKTFPEDKKNEITNNGTDFNLEGITYPEIAELALNYQKKNQSKEKFRADCYVKKIICENVHLFETEVNSNLEKHKGLVNFAIKNSIPIMTTNYDSLLIKELVKRKYKVDYIREQIEDPYWFTENGILENDRQKQKEKSFPCNAYFSENPLPNESDISTQFAVWHIHGMKRYSGSICITNKDYAKVIAKLNGLKKNINFSNWKGRYTWLNPFFNDDLIIIGLALNSEEVDLRWLLVERNIYQKSLPEKDRKKTVYLYTNDKEMPNGKRRLFESLDIECIKKSYNEIYGLDYIKINKI